MGFRSTFVTSEFNYSPSFLPDWFTEKYAAWISFGKCLSSTQEGKTYGVFQDLDADLQKAIKDAGQNDKIDLVFLHECGGITKFAISAEKIVVTEPAGWNKVDSVTHSYCYGCSEPEDGE
jgi:hypothetical protein